MVAVLLEAVCTGASGCCGGRHTLPCGDFNTPQCELSPGEIVTWAQRVDTLGRVRLLGVVNPSACKAPMRARMCGSPASAVVQRMRAPALGSFSAAILGALI
jgi:hypothetical protein